MRAKTSIILAGIYTCLLFFTGMFLSQCASVDENIDSKVGSKPLFFSKKTSETNLQFSNRLQENIFSNENVLTFENFYNGGGVSISDVNNDGLPDVFLCGNQVESKLFLNKGNLQFEDVTLSSGISTKNIWANGVTISDVNQDGWQDIYVCAGGPSLNPEERRNQLWINNQDGTFSNQAKSMGLNDSRWSNQASFFDMDQDGDLDMFLMNHTTFWQVSIPEVDKIMQDPQIRSMASNQLYENLGNGTFKNITIEAGIEKHGYGLGLVTADLNADGLTDIYVSNDYSVPDFMFINLGNGKFRDETKQRIKQISFYGMGCDVADYNNDLNPEIVVVDMAIKDHYRNKTLMASMNLDLFNYLTESKKFPYQYMFNSFQLNNGNGTYSNISNAIGLSKTDWSWTALFSDFDQDQNKDLLISNGIVRYPRDNDFRMEMTRVKNANNGSIPDSEKERLYNMMPSVPLVNKLYQNIGNLKFKDVSDDWGFSQAGFSYGCAYGDLDNDGDVDLVFNNTNAEVTLYENTSNKNYLKVECRDYTGAILNNSKVVITHQGIKQKIEITPTRGYFSSSEPIAHFGLDEVEIVDSIWVRTPTGEVYYATGIKVNQTLKFPSSDFAKYTKVDLVKNKTLFTPINPSSLGISFRHYENPYNEYKKEILLPHSQSSFGPFTAVADVNNDGLEDLFIGGGSQQSGILYQQTPEGGFMIPENQPWVSHFEMEDLGVCFFDANDDGFVDLYIVSGGGSEFENRPDLLQDRLYINDKKGGFYYDQEALPKMEFSGMRVSANDFDNDGDLDLFVGGRTSPGAYPKAPESYLLENKNGVFKNITKTAGPDLKNIGMVTDFVWADIDANGYSDLIITCEWKPIQVFLNTNGVFKPRDDLGFERISGWFYSLKSYDFNKDGKPDFIAGNVGLNNKYGPTAEKPLHIFMNDFDDNGSNDIVLSKKYKEQLVPIRGRECSSQQMPFITTKFASFSSFAEASLNDVYTERKLNDAIHYQVNDFASYAFISNEDGGYTPMELPIEAQLSCINDLMILDVTGDDVPEIIGVGNQFNTEPETPRYDASNGFVLTYSNSGFEVVPLTETNFFIPTNAKSIQKMRLGNQSYIMVGNNAGPLNILSLKKYNSQ